jgi:transposase
MGNALSACDGTHCFNQFSVEATCRAFPQARAWQKAPAALGSAFSGFIARALPGVICRVLSGRGGRACRAAFRRWSKSGLWARIWEALQALRLALGEDHEVFCLDSTAVKAPTATAPGARKELGAQAIGSSRGGRGTKIHAACDALDYPLAMKLSAANESDIHPCRRLDRSPERTAGGGRPRL